MGNMGEICLDIQLHRWVEVEVEVLGLWLLLVVFDNTVGEPDDTVGGLDDIVGGVDEIVGDLEDRLDDEQLDGKRGNMVGICFDILFQKFVEVKVLVLLVVVGVMDDESQNCKMGNREEMEIWKMG